MIEKYILDKNGEPQVCDDPVAWAEWFENNDRPVALTRISENIKVSTVFLGLDQRFGEGPPLLFETMIFGGKHDQYQRRYSTKAEAEKGHKELVEMCKA